MILINIRYYLIKYVLLMMICTGLTGCVINTDSSHSFVAESVEKNNLIFNDSIDYSLYLKKIWVGEEWDGGDYVYPASFFITKIENGKIMGKMSTHRVAEPDFYYYKNAPVLDDFIGTINNSHAECHFTGKNGNTGSLLLDFKEENKIVATMDYNTVRFMDINNYDNTIRKIYQNLKEGEKYYDNLKPMKGTYSFRPYNLEDIKKYIEMEKLNLYKVDLNSWGEVCLATVIFSGDKPHPGAFLLDRDNNILYDYSAPFQVGTEIINVTLEDINDDGLKDVQMETDYEGIVWTFYQKENGVFYDPSIYENSNE